MSIFQTLMPLRFLGGLVRGQAPKRQKLVCAVVPQSPRFPWQRVQKRWAGIQARQNSSGFFSGFQKVCHIITSHDLRATDLVWIYLRERGFESLDELYPVRLSGDQFAELLSDNGTESCDFDLIMKSDPCFAGRFIILIQNKDVVFLPVLEQAVGFHAKRPHPDPLSKELSATGVRFLEEFRLMIDATSELTEKVHQAVEARMKMGTAREVFECMLEKELAGRGALSIYDEVAKGFFDLAGADSLTDDASRFHLAWSPFYLEKFDFLKVMRRLSSRLREPA